MPQQRVVQEGLAHLLQRMMLLDLAHLLVHPRMTLLHLARADLPLPRMTSLVLVRHLVQADLVLLPRMMLDLVHHLLLPRMTLPHLDQADLVPLPRTTLAHLDQEDLVPLPRMTLVLHQDPVDRKKVYL
jgi:hypothetical protein